ncbi:hypothetical protein EB118_16490 [bacterium]|nr:hypothetical protein [Alphaproteobacteria bacterium]NDG31653.1 hypothetical protein [bacterium]
MGLSVSVVSDFPEIPFNPVKSVKDFQEEIDKLVKNKGMEYIEAVVYFCETTGLEIESAASLIKSSAKMKAVIQNEAEHLNYLPKSARLPISDS